MEDWKNAWKKEGLAFNGGVWKEIPKIIGNDVRCGEYF
jgi:hypothetical protein